MAVIGCLSLALARRKLFTSQKVFDVRQLQVITGIGKHSAGGIARLLPAVKQYLSASNLTWNEEPGNPGQINVVIASST